MSDSAGRVIRDGVVPGISEWSPRGGGGKREAERGGDLLPLVQANLPAPPRWLATGVLRAGMPHGFSYRDAVLGRERSGRCFLTVDHIRNGNPAACTLLPGGISPEPVFPHEQLAAVAAPECPALSTSEAQAEAEELLEDICSTLLLEYEASGWVTLAELIGDELFERLDSWLEARLGGYDTVRGLPDGYGRPRALEEREPTQYAGITPQLNLDPLDSQVSAQDRNVIRRAK